MSIFDEYLLHLEETRRLRPPRVLYTTDLTHPCLRQIWLDVINDRQHPPETLRIFDCGRILEDHWVGDILASQKDVAVLARQVKAHHVIDIAGVPWEIHGRADALCQHADGALVLHEVKSAKTAQWMTEPKDDHVAQLQFYLNVLGVEQGQVDYLDKKAWLLGDERVDKSFPLKRDPFTFEQFLKNAALIVAALTSETPPPTNPRAWNGQVCNYCLYEDLCEKEEK